MASSTDDRTKGRATMADRIDFVTKTWNEREAIGKNDMDYKEAERYNEWMTKMDFHGVQVVKQRINQNACIDKLRERISPEEWDSLSPKMRQWMLDMLDILYAVNNA